MIYFETKNPISQTKIQNFKKHTKTPNYFFKNAHIRNKNPA